MSKCSKYFYHKCLLIWIFLHFKRFFQKIFTLSDQIEGGSQTLLHFCFFFLYFIILFFFVKKWNFFLGIPHFKMTIIYHIPAKKTATSSSSYRKKSFLHQCLTDSCNETITKKYTWSIVNLITCENSTGNNLF